MDSESNSPANPSSPAAPRRARTPPPTVSSPPAVTENDLHVHLQNLAPQGKLTMRLVCDDTKATTIGFWNDCIITERNADIYTFYKRTPPMPVRPFNQEEVMKRLEEDKEPILTDVSGYVFTSP